MSLKFTSSILALFFAQQVAAQDLYKELTFYNNAKPVIEIGESSKMKRRAPARVPQLPSCYSGEAAITFISDGDDYVIPYYVSDATGNVVMAGIVDFDPANPGIVDISVLSAGTYSITITCGVEYTASFDVADFEY